MLIAVALLVTLAPQQHALDAAGADMRAGRFAAAAKQYEAYLREAPGSGPALLGLATCYIRTGRRQAAIRMLRRYIKVAPDSERGHSALGLMLYETGRFSEAAPELERALRLDPAQGSAIEPLARTYLLQGRASDAVALLRPAVTLPGAGEQRILLLATALIRTGDVAGAASLLQNLLSRNERCGAEVYAAAAWSYTLLKDARSAAALCEKGMRLYPDSDEISAVYVSLPPEVLAERLAARHAAAEQSADVNELVALARALSDMDPGRKTAAPEMAAQLLGRALKLAPRNPSVHYQYGRALSLRAKPETILAAWEKALSLNPPAELAVMLQTQIARARRSQSDFPGAARAFRAALKINRTLPRPRPDAAFEYVLFFNAEGQPGEARSLLAEIMRWDPLFLPAHIERARDLAVREQWAAAAESAGFVLNNAGNKMELLRPAHAMLARAYAALNQPEKARVHQAWIEAH